VSKLNATLAGALFILLASCGSQDRASENNSVVAPAADAPETASPADPAAPEMPANGGVDPIPPPDAVSHPDGYLPPAPAEPGPASANSSGPDPSSPTTEDEYLRNRQAGR